MNQKISSLLVLTIIVVSVLGVSFKVRMVKAAINQVYIRADGSIDPPIVPINTTDNITYTFTNDLYVELIVERDNITIDGVGHRLWRNGTGKGVDLSDRNNVTVKNLQIENFSSGLWLSQTTHCKILENKIVNNTFGVWVFGSNNTVCRNTITNNSDSGVVIDIFSTDNIISWNNITENNRGIWLIMASSNHIYQNNIVDNSQQVYWSISGYPNFWDNGVEGNYWSNYTGADNNHDGIGDSVQMIDTDNTDNYPLMGMFHSYHITLFDSEFTITLVSNSTISDFGMAVWIEQPENISARTISFSAAGEVGKGFCRLSIPKNQMAPPYTVEIDNGLTPVSHLNASLLDNGTHRWVYFAYEHTTHEVRVVPELPSLVMMPLFMMTALLTALLRKRMKSNQLQ